ncbi:hypothetical protein HDF26_003800 [Pedobacter cryoconitis]|uniref:hypothetical protein n=1 Tax=Pedobacter cryoconitis TaxID=188932 RepID=UPI0016102057|nr:hypothetical protein [Pedobacter cryoconitis]MBB6273340.1 hypothetical protein [Pedobacter cryoconitis]
MIKGFLMFVCSLIFFLFFNERVKVVQRASAVLVGPGYYVAETDSTFEFKKHKYLIKTREFFDQNGEITDVAILKSEGYLEFSKAEFNKLKNFLKIHSFSKTIAADIIDHHYVEINAKRFLIEGVDKKRKIIFYSSQDQKEMLYYLIYK